MINSHATIPTAAQLICSRGETDAVLNLGTLKERNKVMAKVEAMLSIEQCIVSGLSQRDAIAEVSNRHRHEGGFAPGSLTRDFILWSHGGQKGNARGQKSGQIFPPRDWRIFIPLWNNGNPDAALDNEAFTTHIQQLFADTCREDATGNALFQRLLDDWYAGKDIPGFGNIYAWSASQGRSVPMGQIRRASDYPDGWSVNNLRRMLPKSKAARTLIQRGEHAAHDHWGDQLLRDRSKLMPFQLLTFDDVRCDIRVIMELPGRKAQVVYPEAVFAIDVATGLILAKGMVGHYEREEDSDGGLAGTKRGIQQADTKFLLLGILERFGLPRDWQMAVILENASASLSETDMHAFESLTGIKMDNTGLIHKKLVASGFEEQGGQPWAKGWIESYFHLLHTTTNHLPGTVGRRYDLTAGDRDAAARYALSTVREALKQGKSISDLKLPILTMEQYHDLLDEYVARLNWRTTHKLQGFCKVYEAQLPDGEYVPYNDPRGEQLIAEGAVFEWRMEAPAERFRRLMQGHRMQRAHPHQLMPLALEKQPVSVLAGKVKVTRSGRDDMFFRDADTAAALEAWDGKLKALIGFLAADESCIHLFTNDEDLRYVASPRNVARVDMTDRDEVLCGSGEVDRGRDRIRDEVAELLEPRNQQYADMRAHNDRVLGRAETPATPRCEVGAAISQAEADKRRTDATQRALRGTKRTIHDIFDVPAAPETRTQDVETGPSLNDLF